MENTHKLDTCEAISIIIIIMINKLILNIPYYIVDLVGTGAIVNLIYVGIIDFLLILLKFILRYFSGETPIIFLNAFEKYGWSA